MPAGFRKHVLQQQQLQTQQQSQRKQQHQQVVSKQKQGSDKMFDNFYYCHPSLIQTTVSA